jgi:hypothetical protein
VTKGTPSISEDSSQFWALFYLQTVSKVDTLTSSLIVGAGLIIGTPTLIFSSVGCLTSSAASR